MLTKVFAICFIIIFPLIFVIPQEENNKYEYSEHAKQVIKGKKIDNSPKNLSIDFIKNVQNIDEWKSHFNIVTVNYDYWYTKLEPNQIYHNNFYGIQVTHEWNNPRLISINLDYDDYIPIMGIYAFIPKEIWNYELNYNWKYEIETAKQFNESWYLIFSEYYAIYNSWTTEDDTLFDFPRINDFWNKKWYFISDQYANLYSSYNTKTGDYSEVESYKIMRSVIWKFEIASYDTEDFTTN